MGRADCCRTTRLKSGLWWAVRASDSQTRRPSATHPTPAAYAPTCLAVRRHGTARAEIASPAALLKEPVPRYGTPVLVAPRLGQGTFRIARNEESGVETVTQDSAVGAIFDPRTRKFRRGGIRNLPLSIFQLKLRKALEDKR